MFRVSGRKKKKSVISQTFSNNCVSASVYCEFDPYALYPIHLDDRILLSIETREH